MPLVALLELENLTMVGLGCDYPLIKTKFSYMSVMKNQSKNAKSLSEHAKIPSENPKTQFENAKTQKTAQVLAQGFLDRRSKKALKRYPKYPMST